MYENYLDSRSHSFGTSSSSRTVLPRRSSPPFFPHRTSPPFFPHRTSPPFFPHRTSPPFFPHRFPAYAIKTESSTSCTVSLSTPQDRIAAETHRDAPGDVFIAILLTVISFDPSYDPSSEPSCEPSCNPSCGTARASFLPLTINRIAAETHAGMLRATCSLQFCFRSSLPIIPKKQFAIGVYT